MVTVTEAPEAPSLAKAQTGKAMTPAPTRTGRRGGPPRSGRWKVRVTIADRPDQSRPPRAISRRRAAGERRRTRTEGDQPGAEAATSSAWGGTRRVNRSNQYRWATVSLVVFVTRRAIRTTTWWPARSTV